MLVEGVHFTRDLSPQAIGYKSICCSVSDIAAMGGIPKHAVISMAIDPARKLDFILKNDTVHSIRFSIHCICGIYENEEHNIFNKPK